VGELLRNDDLRSSVEKHWRQKPHAQAKLVSGIQPNSDPEGQA
jgi:hypothetical protein